MFFVVQRCQLVKIVQQLVFKVGNVGRLATCKIGMDENDVFVMFGVFTVFQKEHDVFLGDFLEGNFLGKVFMIGGNQIVQQELVDEVVVHGFINGGVLLALKLVDTVLEMSHTIVHILTRKIDSIDVFEGDGGRNVTLFGGEATFLTDVHVFVRKNQVRMKTLISTIRSIRVIYHR